MLFGPARSKQQSVICHLGRLNCNLPAQMRYTSKVHSTTVQQMVKVHAESKDPQLCICLICTGTELSWANLRALSLRSNVSLRILHPAAMCNHSNIAGQQAEACTATKHSITGQQANSPGKAVPRSTSAPDRTNSRPACATSWA